MIEPSSLQQQQIYNNEPDNDPGNNVQPLNWQPDLLFEMLFFLSIFVYLTFSKVLRQTHSAQVQAELQKLELLGQDQRRTSQGL